MSGHPGKISENRPFLARASDKHLFLMMKILFGILIKSRFQSPFAAFNAPLYQDPGGSSFSKQVFQKVDEGESAESVGD
jgi:hypothetical protein